MAKKSFGNLDKVEHIGGGLSSLTNPSSRSQEHEYNEKIKDKTYIVKTFNIEEDDFLYIKKYVKHRRMNGDTDYTQKEALGEAIKLLRQNTPKLS